MSFYGFSPRRGKNISSLSRFTLIGKPRQVNQKLIPKIKETKYNLKNPKTSFCFDN